MIRVCWREMQVLKDMLPAGCIAKGERKRLVMPRKHQYEWLESLFIEPVKSGKDTWQLWLETDVASYQAGSSIFFQKVSSMLHHRGMMANLSFRENLMLPFLYHANHDALEQAEQDLPQVAEFLDIKDCLDDQASIRSPYTHGLISLGRCLLQKPDIILVQDVHVGLAPHRMRQFHTLFCEVMERLQAGILYISTSEHDGSGMNFEDSLELNTGSAA